MISYGWPWGENQPTRLKRFVVAACIATVAAFLVYYEYQSAAASYHTDFGLSWFGARSLLNGQDPYPLVGPASGLPFRWKYYLLYPATAFVPVMPLAVFPEQIAGSLFVWISTLLLVYGMTARSWHLLPIIPSFSFLLNVQRVQWTILITSMLFLPAVSFVVVAKPQFGLPVIGASEKPRAWYAALIGSVVIVGVSLALLPSWPSEWLNLVRSHSEHLHAPVTRPLGFLIPLVLLRWKQRDAWFVFLLACVPQTFDYYNTLPLLALAASYREACLLSVITTFGGVLWMLSGLVLATNVDELQSYGAIAIVLFAYLPSVVMILRRPAGGEVPVWIRLLTQRSLPRGV